MLAHSGGWLAAARPASADARTRPLMADRGDVTRPIICFSKADGTRTRFDLSHDPSKLSREQLPQSDRRPAAGTCRPREAARGLERRRPDRDLRPHPAGEASAKAGPLHAAPPVPHPARSHRPGVERREVPPGFADSDASATLALELRVRPDPAPLAHALPSLSEESGVRELPPSTVILGDEPAALAQATQHAVVARVQELRHVRHAEPLRVELPRPVPIDRRARLPSALPHRGRRSAPRTENSGARIASSGLIPRARRSSSPWPPTVQRGSSAQASALFVSPKTVMPQLDPLGPSRMPRLMFSLREIQVQFPGA